MVPRAWAEGGCVCPEPAAPFAPRSLRERVCRGSSEFDSGRWFWDSRSVLPTYAVSTAAGVTPAATMTTRNTHGRL